MTTSHNSITKTALFFSLAGIMVVGTNLSSLKPAIAIQFQSPGDSAPHDTTGGGSRGDIQFQAPGDSTPNNSTGGGIRGNINFQAPGDSTPQNTTGGATRGNVSFQAPGESTPQNTTGGATRGNVSFQAPGESTPQNTTGGATRGDVNFQAPGESTPQNTTGGATRGNVSFQAPGESTPQNTTGAATRSEKISNLVALIPQTKIGRTIAAHPTFFVYLPPTSATNILFTMQDENKNQFYQTNLQVSGQGGIVKITLPDDAPELALGKNYAWFFTASVPGAIIRPDNHFVSGWVKRVEAPTISNNLSKLNAVEVATLYAKSGIWYDTIAVLNAAKQAQPNNTTLKSEWRDLLAQVGLDAIANQSVLEPL